MPCSLREHVADQIYSHCDVAQWSQRHGADDQLSPTAVVETRPLNPVTL